MTEAVPDEDTQRGRWLPPRAPGAAEPPHYERGPTDAPRWQAPARGSEWRAEPDAAPDAPTSEPAPPAESQPPAGAPRGERPTFVTAQRDPRSTAATAIAVIAILLLVLSLGAGFWLTMPLSGVAMYLGRRQRAQAEATRRPGTPAPSNAAWVLGRIGVILGVLAALGWIIAIVGFDYGPGDLNDDLRRELERQSRAALIWAARSLLGR